MEIERQAQIQAKELKDQAQAHSYAMQDLTQKFEMQIEDLGQTIELLKGKLQAATTDSQQCEKSKRDLQTELSTEISQKEKRIQSLQQ